MRLEAADHSADPGVAPRAACAQGAGVRIPVLWDAVGSSVCTPLVSSYTTRLLQLCFSGSSPSVLFLLLKGPIVTHAPRLGLVSSWVCAQILYAVELDDSRVLRDGEFRWVFFRSPVL